VARRALAVLLAATLVVACTNGGEDDGAGPPPTTTPRRSTAATSTTVVHPRGGSVRVAVRGEADPAAPTLTGAAVRALVLPRLFVPMPDGTWAPSLVEPGSERVAADQRSVAFRLRAATWSDGSPLVAADLARTADHALVASVDGSADGRAVTVGFTRAVADWHRLWSGVDSIAAPRPDVWGGPFVVAARTPGLETVLRRNDRWWGAPAPWLDEVRLVTVVDETTARLLLARGELDVVAPIAATNRTPQYRAITGIGVDVGAAAPAGGGGWWFGLLLNADRLDGSERRRVVGSLDATRFRTALLAGEVADAAGLPAAEGGGGAVDVTLTGTTEDPMTALVERALLKKARAAGGDVELRNAETDRVERWVAAGDYDAALVWRYDVTPADAGAVGLWRPIPVAAWRQGAVAGVRASAYGLSAAWNAWEWFRP
jgi:ABC-type transport system substrate-binding protein